jgi:glutathione reductase (NADPH)
MDFDLFVIGGGSAGVRCARISAGYGARVGIAEERFWGGTCVNVGCVPKKLIAAKDHEIGRLAGIYRHLLDGAGATVFETRARFLDAHTLDVGGKRLTAERIVIATGGHPVRLPIPGAELGIVSDDAFYLPRMPKRVAVLGSGYIAVEFAGIFAALGAQVDLVFRQPLPLRGFDHDLREAVAEALGAQGVALHPSCTPRRVEADGEQRRLIAGEDRTIRTDLVFFATGRRPATAAMGLEVAGVTTDAAGAVVVDEHLRTSQPHIFAIGDVTNRLNLTPDGGGGVCHVAHAHAGGWRGTGGGVAGRATLTYGNS